MFLLFTVDTRKDLESVKMKIRILFMFSEYETYLIKIQLCKESMSDS
jgi:hypothetical protein